MYLDLKFPFACSNFLGGIVHLKQYSLFFKEYVTGC